MSEKELNVNVTVVKHAIARIQKVQVFKTSDGKTFEDKLEAEQHEAFVTFSRWYEDNDLGMRPDAEDVTRWLGDNIEVVKELIEWMEKA